MRGIILIGSWLGWAAQARAQSAPPADSPANSSEVSPENAYLRSQLGMEGVMSNMGDPWGISMSVGLMEGVQKADADMQRYHIGDPDHGHWDYRTAPAKDAQGNPKTDKNGKPEQAIVKYWTYNGDKDKDPSQPGYVGGISYNRQFPVVTRQDLQAAADAGFQPAKDKLAAMAMGAASAYGAPPAGSPGGARASGPNGQVPKPGTEIGPKVTSKDTSGYGKRMTTVRIYAGAQPLPNGRGPSEPKDFSTPPRTGGKGGSSQARGSPAYGSDRPASGMQYIGELDSYVAGGNIRPLEELKTFAEDSNANPVNAAALHFDRNPLSAHEPGKPAKDNLLRGNFSQPQ